MPEEIVAPPPKSDPVVPGTPVRPESLPESYWDEATAAPRFDVLGQHLAERDTLKASLAEHESRLAQRPEKPEAYQAALPEDFKLPEELGALEVKFDTESGTFKQFQTFAHEAGFTPAQFSQALALMVSYQAEGEIKARQADTEALKSLGANSEKRIEAAKTWIAAKKLDGLFADSPADRLKAVESLMKIPGMTAAPSNGMGARGPNVDGLKPGYQKLAAINEYYAKR